MHGPVEEEQEEKAFTTLWVNLNRLSLLLCGSGLGCRRVLELGWLFWVCFVWNKWQAKELWEQNLCSLFSALRKNHTRDKSMLVFTVYTLRLFVFSRKYSFICFVSYAL
jgi:hypothetical protein